MWLQILLGLFNKLLIISSKFDYNFRVNPGSRSAHYQPIELLQSEQAPNWLTWLQFQGILWNFLFIWWDFIFFLNDMFGSAMYGM